MKKVECMFSCTQSKFDGDSEDPQGEVQLYAVTDDTPEHERYWKYTPSGQMELGLINQETTEFFESGGTYRITIERVE